MLRDVRYALRVLCRTPGFSVAAVLTLALGIGLTTTVFSITDGVLFRPLPYKDPDRLVALFGAARPEGQYRMSVSAADFLDWRAQNRAFEDVAAYGSGPVLRLMVQADWIQLRAANVSGSFLDALGVRPYIGRGFDASELQPGAAPAALLTYGAWQRVFGGDASAVGRTLTSTPLSVRIVGVLPRSFAFPIDYARFAPDVLLPLAFAPEEASRRNVRFLFLIARLRSGVTLEFARTDMDAIALRLKPLFVPRPNVIPGAFDGVTIVPLHEQMGRRSKPALAAVFGTVCFVLLIACVNVTTLLLARGVERERELAVRAAIGASTTRLARQLFAESLVLAAAGGALGLLLAYWSFEFVAAQLPAQLQFIKMPAIDHRVMIFSLIASVTTAVVFGVVPAVKLSRPDVAGSLGSMRTGSPAGGVVRGALIAIEAAIALVLLVGGGLMANSFLRVQRQETGFGSPGHIVTLPVVFGTTVRPANDGAVAAMVADALNRVRTLPGVSAAAATDGLLLASAIKGTRFKPPAGVAVAMATDLSVTPEYFKAMGIPVLKGRVFDPARDRTDVAVVSQGLARRYWPNQDPIGQVLESSWTSSRQVIGVVGDTRDMALDHQIFPNIYLLYGSGNAAAGITLVVRTTSRTAEIGLAVRRATRALGNDVIAETPRTLDELMARSIAERRFHLLLFGVFAATGLLLAAIGVYAIVSYSVGQRTREIGIRLALGAQARHIRAAVAGGVMRWIGAGTAVGIAASVGLSRFLKSLLFQLTPTDPTTLASVSLLLIAVAAAATLVPAHRALRIDPAAAMRTE